MGRLCRVVTLQALWRESAPVWAAAYGVVLNRGIFLDQVIWFRSCGAKSVLGNAFSVAATHTFSFGREG